MMMIFLGKVITCFVIGFYTNWQTGVAAMALTMLTHMGIVAQLNPEIININKSFKYLNNKINK